MAMGEEPKKSLKARSCMTLISGLLHQQQARSVAKAKEKASCAQKDGKMNNTKTMLLIISSLQLLSSSSSKKKGYTWDSSAFHEREIK